MIDLPLIFERVYLRPLAITSERFLAGHMVLSPRLLGQSSAPLVAAAGSDSPLRPHRSPYTGKRLRHCGPQVSEVAGELVSDPRFYNVPLTGVAAVPITGTLMHHASSMEEMCTGATDISAIGVALRQVLADEAIHTVVLDIDSPGGECTGIEELGTLIRQVRARKTVYAFCDGQMCSAAYWLGSQATELYVTRSSSIGSIGVFCAWFDPAVKMQKEGVALRLFKAGKHKAIGLPGRALSKEDEALMQEGVDRVYTAFTTAVSSARPGLSSAHFEAQVYDGAKAVTHNMADAIVGSWEDFLSLLV